MIIRAKSPLRISFAGGGTDVSPYPELYCGCVLNATINKYAYTTLEVVDKPGIEVHSLDYDYMANFSANESLDFDGQLDLAKAVIKRLHCERNGFRIFTHNDAPPGSGLGSSSAMVVSLLGAFKNLKSLTSSNYDIANLAYEIERNDLKIVGGKQDQYACVFGGFNFIEFDKDHVLVNPLRVKPEVINELQYNLLLCYTGKNRLSGKIIEAQVKNLNDGRKSSIDAMHSLKLQAGDMKKALLTGNTRHFGELLHHAWASKKQMADVISNSILDEYYEEAILAGAIGGKVSGAGGGGFMFFYCESGKKHKVAQRLEQMGGEVVGFEFEHNGLQSWRTSAVKLEPVKNIWQHTATHNEPVSTSV